LYLQSLRDIAWVEDTRLIFLIFHAFVCKLFDWVDVVQGKKKYRTMYGKLKIN